MRRYTIVTVFASVFLLFLWSCSKDKAAPVPALAATTKSNSDNARDKMATIKWLSTNIINPTVGTIRPLGNINFNNLNVITPGGISLGRVIFNDNLITINIKTNGCVNCHGAPIHVGANISDASVRTHAQTALQNPDELISKMNNKSVYPQLFREAFGSSEITAERINDALAQYIVAMGTDQPQTAEAVPVAAYVYK